MSTNVSVASLPKSTCESSAGFDEILRFNRRGLFVGGCPKSGTTLLMTLLDSHPELVVLPVETHFFDDAKSYRALGDHQAKMRHLLARPEFQMFGQERFEPSRQFDPARFRALMEECVGNAWMNDSLLLSEAVRAYAMIMGYAWQDCVRWVEKTPSNVPFAGDLFRLFPDAKLIHIVRDPRAVFASRQRLITKQVGRYKKAHRLAREWNESSRQMERLKKHGAQYLVIRYEDLVQNSRAILEEVCQFIGIEFLPTLLEPTRAGRQWQGNSAFHEGFQGIDSQPLNHWKDQLTGDEIWWIEWHCRKGMKIAGYQPQTDARFSFRRWLKRLPSESWNGYLHARKSSLCQMAGLLKDCRYEPAPKNAPPKGLFNCSSAPAIQNLKVKS